MTFEKNDLALLLERGDVSFAAARLGTSRQVVDNWLTRGTGHSKKHDWQQFHTELSAIIARRLNDPEYRQKMAARLNRAAHIIENYETNGKKVTRENNGRAAGSEHHPESSGGNED